MNIFKIQDNDESLVKQCKWIHGLLLQLTFYNKNSFNIEETLVEDFNFLEIVSGKCKNNFISIKTKMLLSVFRKEWLKLKNNKIYGEDFVFLSFDPDFHHFIGTHLIPALESMERDFDKYGIDYTSYKLTYNPDARPSDEEILERGRALYGLLSKHRVITRDYMDQ